MSVSRTRVFLVIAVLALLLVACNASDRPDASSWETEWDAFIALVPPRSDLGDPPSESVCQSTLAAIREESGDLLPSPTATVDDMAHEWISLAENAFFECPPDGEEINSFDDVYSALQRVEESVNDALADSG